MQIFRWNLLKSNLLKGYLLLTTLAGCYCLDYCWKITCININFQKHISKYNLEAIAKHMIKPIILDKRAKNKKIKSLKSNIATHPFVIVPLLAAIALVIWVIMFYWLAHFFS